MINKREYIKNIKSDQMKLGGFDHLVQRFVSVSI